MLKLNPRYPSNKDKNAFWLQLIGTAEMFPLERRIFHSISLGFIVIMCIYIPYNFYAGLYIASISALIFAVMFVQQYYNSRVNGVPHSNALVGLSGIIILGFNYFTNSGINGSTDVIWPASLLLVFAISPYKQHLWWLLIYVFGFLIIHTIEYYHPELIQHPFSAGKGQFIDRITAFPLPVILIYIIIKFIRQRYDKERMELEKSNIEKNKLMSIISHDLRAPLTNIQNYLELLNDNEIDSADRPRLEKSLLKSTNSAMDMLSNLLHWSKSQMDGLNVHLVEVELITVLHSTLELEKIIALKKNITLNNTIPAALAIVADVDMLQLVVRNLVSNAIKFTPEGGTIDVTAIVEGETCEISVTDNGKGIDDDRQDRIFSMKSEPSYGTNNEKGVGLGLVLCKEFIERQGGTISFKSTSGGGSSFFIVLPLAVVKD
ncbi:MAG: HAMP domain-containing sensor histidine kinase [Bacteroidota bacterium]